MKKWIGAKSANKRLSEDESRRLAASESLRDATLLWSEGGEVAKRLIDDYVAGMLNEVDAARLEERAAKEPELANRIAEARATFEAPIPAGILDRLDQFVDALTSTSAQGHRNDVKVSPTGTLLPPGLAFSTSRDVTEYGDEVDDDSESEGGRQ